MCMRVPIWEGVRAPVRVRHTERGEAGGTATTLYPQPLNSLSIPGVAR